MHVHNLVSTLNQIKDKTGLYIFMEGSKYDWLEYASNDTINVDLFVTPKKTVINLTIQAYLADQWAIKWENIKGHAQTKFWCTGPDPILASKLLNMSREHLGWCIQFITGHGWRKKHLKLTNLCNDDICRLCKRPDSIESPIHLFTECTELSAIRQDLFNDPYPSQLVIHNQLCQVTEFALVGQVCDLINIYSYISQSPLVTNLTGRQVENRFCTVLYRFLHLLQARPGGIFSIQKFTCVGESHRRPRVDAGTP